LIAVSFTSVYNRQILRLPENHGMRPHDYDLDLVAAAFAAAAFAAAAFDDNAKRREEAQALHTHVYQDYGLGFALAAID